MKWDFLWIGFGLVLAFLKFKGFFGRLIFIGFVSLLLLVFFCFID